MNAPIDILDLLSKDENVSPALRAAIKPTTLAERIEAKREAVREDSFGDDLWFARGGEA